MVPGPDLRPGPSAYGDQRYEPLGARSPRRTTRPLAQRGGCPGVIASPGASVTWTSTTSKADGGLTRGLIRGRAGRST